MGAHYGVAATSSTLMYEKYAPVLLTTCGLVLHLPFKATCAWNNYYKMESGCHKSENF